MPNNKNQHFVPQSYLKLFSNDQKRINLFYKREEKFIIGSIASQCSKDYFYSNNTSVEQELSKLEAIHIAILHKITSEKKLSTLTEDELNQLRSGILVQYGRTQKIAKRVDEMANNLLNLLKPEIINYAKDKGEEIGEEDLEGVEIRMEKPVGWPLIISMLSGVLISDLEIALINNTSQTDLVVSDAPAILFNSYFNCRREGGTKGYASRGLQIIYPINSKLLLFLYDPTCYTINKNNDGIVIVSRNTDIQRLNGLQVIYSNHNIFFQNESMKSKIFERYNQLKNKLRNKDIATLKVGEKIYTGGERGELYQTYEEDIDYDIEKLSFLKHTNSNIEYGVRNEELYDLHVKFVDAVLDRKVKSVSDVGDVWNRIRSAPE